MFGRNQKLDKRIAILEQVLEDNGLLGSVIDGKKQVRGRPIVESLWVKLNGIKHSVKILGLIVNSLETKKGRKKVAR